VPKVILPDVIVPALTARELSAHELSAPCAAFRSRSRLYQGERFAAGASGGS
jgi:hypothetical protein